MLRKATAAVTTFRNALLVLLPTGWRIYEVPRRIDVAIVVAGVGEPLGDSPARQITSAAAQKATHLLGCYRPGKAKTPI
jgi:hypothetical protein